MNAAALSALEFDRIVGVLAGLAITPTGQERLSELQPAVDPPRVAAALKATTEGTRFLATRPGLPLRAPSDLLSIIDALAVEGRALEPLRLIALADYLESIEQCRGAVRNSGASFPILEGVVARGASFREEIRDVRRALDPAGEVADNATPRLAGIRDRLRRQRAKLRTALDGFLRNRDTAKYLQDQVVSDRHGRYVLVVRAEHRASIPGIVHGSSASGASLYLEPLATVEINNDVVAVQEEEAEEVRRILLMLTDAFRVRPDDLAQTMEVATQLDVVQARARLSQLVGGIEPALATDGAFELRAARHPLLMRTVNDRLTDGRTEGIEPVPVNIMLTPPHRILLITGPNTGGKTVALKTAGLLTLMAQAGLHIPADEGSKLPVFRTVFADIGDEQSISASLSTFSAHITNLVAMDRGLTLPALVLLDEVGAGTDPVEGGALGVAVIDHFRARGAHLIGTTHYDALKTYASATAGVVSAAFGFNPENFAPTYQLIYGSPGRSLAIEIAARLGLPPSVIGAARANMTDREKQLADHLARIDAEMASLERERRTVRQERAGIADTERELRQREQSVRDREDAFTKRLNARLDNEVRAARREIDIVIEGLKTRSAELSEQAARQLREAPGRLVRPLSTGETGAVRADARKALEDAIARVKQGDVNPAASAPPGPPTAAALTPGVRVTVGALGLEGTVVGIHGKHAEVDVRGKRLRAALRDLRVIAGSVSPQSSAQRASGSEHGVGAADPRSAGQGGSGRVHVNIELQPREGPLSELNVIGCTVEEALDRTEKFLDAATVSDQRSVRIIHGHGTGQLRRAVGEYLRSHPLVAHVSTAPNDQGGAGATVVELKD